ASISARNTIIATQMPQLSAKVRPKKEISEPPPISRGELLMRLNGLRSVTNGESDANRTRLVDVLRTHLAVERDSVRIAGCLGGAYAGINGFDVVEGIAHVSGKGKSLALQT